MKNTPEVKVKVEFTPGYEERYTRACLKQLERREKRLQAGPPGSIGKRMEEQGIA